MFIIDAVENRIDDTKKYLDIPLAYSKTPEEEYKEQQNVYLAERYLESLGIKVKVEYGYYRHTYDILKDLGEYLSKNDSKIVR